VFRHDQNPGGLYTPFYQYFLTRWENPDIPEYDLDSDDLVYRDVTGSELKRKKFHPSQHEAALNTGNDAHEDGFPPPADGPFSYSQSRGL
jgi:hypothetical protein